MSVTPATPSETFAAKASSGGSALHTSKLNHLFFNKYRTRAPPFR